MSDKSKNKHKGVLRYWYICLEQFEGEVSLQDIVKDILSGGWEVIDLSDRPALREKATTLKSTVQSPLYLVLHKITGDRLYFKVRCTFRSMQQAALR